MHVIFAVKLGVARDARHSVHEVGNNLRLVLLLRIVREVKNGIVDGWYAELPALAAPHGGGLVDFTGVVELHNHLGHLVGEDAATGAARHGDGCAATTTTAAWTAQRPPIVWLVRAPLLVPASALADALNVALAHWRAATLHVRVGDKRLYLLVRAPDSPQAARVLKERLVAPPLLDFVGQLELAVWLLRVGVFAAVAMDVIEEVVYSAVGKRYVNLPRGCYPFVEPPARMHRTGRYHI